jgi:hypothetical protein
MWEPPRLTTLWASMACYTDNFPFFYFHTSKLKFLKFGANLSINFSFYVLLLIFIQTFILCSILRPFQLRERILYDYCSLGGLQSVLYAKRQKFLPFSGTEHRSSSLVTTLTELSKLVCHDRNSEACRYVTLWLVTIWYKLLTTFRDRISQLLAIMRFKYRKPENR